MADEKKEADQLKLVLHQLVEGKFKDYRASGIALSVTLITLSSALLVWANHLRGSLSQGPCTLRCVLTAQIIFFALTIFSCLLIQFANYQGYKHEARASIVQSKYERATCWFTCEDNAVYLSLVLFAIGVALSGYMFFSS